MNALRAVLLSGVLLAGCNAMPARPDRTETDKIKVGELLNTVKKATRDAQTQIEADRENRLPPLASLSVTMQTKKTATGSVSADLLVVSGQVKGENASTQTISVKLTPPKPGLKALDEKDQYDAVVDAIKAASVAAKAAFSSNPNDLQLTSVSATVAFDVSRVANGGLKLDLGAVKVGPGFSFGVSDSQRIDLVFQRP